VSAEPDLVTVPVFVQPRKLKPEHYKVICISTYTSDLAKLDGIVAELKRRGFTKASRSGVLRAAMEQLNLDRIKPGSLR
jgi:hypothetical protein